MCFLWNLEASQGGDLGPNLCVAWSTDVLAAVLEQNLVFLLVF